MRNLQLIVEIVFFGFALWLGLYLISRNLQDMRLLLAGLGLLAYSAGLGLDALATVAQESELVDRLASWQRIMLFAPAIFWLAMLISLIPGDLSIRERLRRHSKPWGVILAASLFFALGLGFIYFPVSWLPRIWALLGIGVDLLLLGVALAIVEAAEEGQRLAPHFLRSLNHAFFTSLIFGGQIAIAMRISTGVTLPMVLLLFSTLTAAIFLQTFSQVIGKALDDLSFFSFPQLRQTTAQLQIASEAASRVNESLDILAIDEEEFARYTRRALSYMGNLPKLASSPLTQIALVEQQVTSNGNLAGTLERANILKVILRESIERLKPRDQGDFGRSDEWRHYNALYFPYVQGLKPYSRRIPGTYASDETLNQALEWFRGEVPQRTLYNWQNAAAQLVASDLRERSLQLIRA